MVPPAKRIKIKRVSLENTINNRPVLRKKLVKNDCVSPEEVVKSDTESDDNENDNLTYEQLREKRINANMNMFEALGINRAAEILAKSVISKKRTPRKSIVSNRTRSKNVTPTPIRRSMRIANVPAPNIQIEGPDKIARRFSLDKNSFNSVSEIDSISVPEEGLSFFEKLSEELCVKEAVNDFHTCNFDRFSNVVKSLELNEELSVRVVSSRIYSLAIHPSETSLLIAVGSQKGHLTLFNPNNSDTLENRVHDGPVNCASFCSWDPLKLFTTSHDGVVRCGDILKRTFDIIYSSDLWESSYKSSHITWHTEYERNLLIGCGSGRVDLVDTRILNKIQKTAWCHARSVRTVHCHPLQNHYFLTSSGLGEVSLWDVRKMTDKKIDPVLEFHHSRSVTSAFFSGSGINMVSTSNDDCIRIFNTTKLSAEATKPVHKINHNNHTGRWLSVFKAKWNPGRDDAFFVGSMQVPKRMQIYCADGSLLHNLTDSNITTYNPVIEAHPTQAIYVGGNGTGRLHVFCTKEQFQ